MLIRSMVAMLDRARSPLAVRMIARGLELRTGIRTEHLLEAKTVTGYTFSTVEYSQDWHARNARVGGHLSYSGKSVTTDSATELGAVLACVKIISEDEGTMPFVFHERSEDGQQLRRAYDHELYPILHDLANPDMSSGEFREALTAQAALGCDGFAKIAKSSTGKIAGLFPYALGQVTQVAVNPFGRTVYIVKEGNAAEKTYDAEEIFHLKAFTFTGRRGDDILLRARHAIGLGLAAQEYAARFFSHDASPGIILQRPAGAPVLSPDETRKVKAAWKEWHQGLSRAHEPAMLVDGTTAVRLDPDHQKLQLLESRRNQVVEVARLYRMPLHKLADLDRSTNNNIEHQGIEYVSQTLAPWNRRWKDAVHRMLRPEERYWRNGRPRFFAEMNVEALQRGDFKTQTEGFAVLLDKGVLTINDVLRFLNMNPVPGGDTRLVQIARATLEDVVAGKTLKPAGGDAPSETVQ
jgi:HK97 family phage portal protein